MLQRFWREDVGWPPKSEHSTSQHERAIEVRGGKSEIVESHEEGDRASSKAFKRFDDVPFGVYIKAGERLVHQDEFSFLSQGARDEHPLPLPAREGIDSSIGEAYEIHDIECVSNDVAVGCVQSPERTETTDASHRNDVGHRDGESPVDGVLLRNVRDAEMSLRHMSVHLDPSGRRRKEAGDRLKERALAGAVRADNRDAHAGLNVKGDPGNGDPPGV